MMDPVKDETDWLVENYTSTQAKEAVLLSLSALIQIARQCCSPPLSLEETQELMETVWYEMAVPEEEEKIL